MRDNNIIRLLNQELCERSFGYDVYSYIQERGYKLGPCENYVCEISHLVDSKEIFPDDTFCGFENGINTKLISTVFFKKKEGNEIIKLALSCEFVINSYSPCRGSIRYGDCLSYKLSMAEDL